MNRLGNNIEVNVKREDNQVNDDDVTVTISRGAERKERTIEFNVLKEATKFIYLQDFLCWIDQTRLIVWYV